MNLSENMIIRVDRTSRNNWLRVYLPPGSTGGPINAAILGKNAETVREFILEPGHNLVDLSQVNSTQLLLKLDTNTETFVREIVE